MVEKRDTPVEAGTANREEQEQWPRLSLVYMRDERKNARPPGREEPSPRLDDILGWRPSALINARAVRARQKAAEGGGADPLVRARRAAARLRD